MSTAYIQWLNYHKEVGQRSSPFHSLSLFLLSLSLPLSSPLLPRSGPRKPARGVEERCPVGSGAKPDRKRIQVYFELENHTRRQDFKKKRPKNSCIGKKCRNGVSAFKKVAERRYGST